MTAAAGRGGRGSVDVMVLEAAPVRLSLRERLTELYWEHVWRVSSLLFAAAWVWRRLLRRTRWVAITGSLGKTTCKELTAACLAARHSTFRSPGNHNARAAVALNVLHVRPWHRFAVLEVAVGGPGDMTAAARVVRPDIAVVLCVKRTHTVAFTGGTEQHAAEKARLLAALRPGGVAVVNAEDPLVAAMKVPAGARVVSLATDRRGDLRATPIEARWPQRLTLRVASGDGEQTVTTRLLGAHWWPAVAAALAVAREAGVPLATAAEAIAATEPYPARLQPVVLPSGATLLRDDYNASVDSSRPAFDLLAEARVPRRVLVVTDISDAGCNRKNRLRMLAAEAVRCADLLVVVGENAAYGARRAVAAGMQREAAVGCATLQEAVSFLRRELRDGDLVLLKGRTTDHAARLLWAQLGPIACWLKHCPKRGLCDTCPELGSPAAAADRPYNGGGG